jgi:hypothetical protein
MSAGRPAVYTTTKMINHDFPRLFIEPSIKMFFVDDAIMSAISAISSNSNGTAALSSADCNYYSCDHSELPR